MKYPILFSLPLLTLLLVFPALGNDTQVLRRLPPPAAAPTDLQLRTFLSTLRSAVRQRDADALKALMASDIKLTFGPPPKAPPEDVLQLVDPNSSVWGELQSLLELGGAYPTPSRDVYCVPYTYAAFPGDVDPYNHQVLIQPAVPARAAPADDAAIVAMLDYAIVQTDYGTPTLIRDDSGREWIKIYLVKTTAYVPAESLRSPSSSRACFTKRDNHWLITHLSPGGD